MIKRSSKHSKVLQGLKHSGYTFEVSVIGESFGEVSFMTVRWQKAQWQQLKILTPKEGRNANTVKFDGKFQVPEIFEVSRTVLDGMIRNWGYASSRDEYLKILRSADVVVSTARHEFYGVAVLEAVFCGTYPLVPNRLSYPFFFPEHCLYNTTIQLSKR